MPAEQQDFENKDKNSAPSVRDEDRARLDSLDRKLAEADARAEHKNDDLAITAGKLTPATMRAARVGFEILLAVLVGLGIGWGLDRHFNSLPLFSLLFGLIGFAAGIMNAWRAVQGVYDEVGFQRDKAGQDRVKPGSPDQRPK